MSSKIKLSLASLTIFLGSFFFANSAEINYPGFTGTVNTTLTTGLSMRIERDCLSEPGEITLDATYIANATSQFGSYAAPYLAEGFGCAKVHRDGYGNPIDSVAGVPRKLISSNANDGNMNFDGGEIFDATTRVYSEIMGTTTGGVDLKLSFVGSYNPITTFTTPVWAPFSNDQLDNIETNIDLLDAYISTDVAALDATVTIGNHVTNWGESTFIPIGMNGLVTNALDLTKLRVPGAEIKEALVPATQLTVSGFLNGGWSYEAYIQAGESHVELDENGTFFGNEVASGDRLTFTSAFSGNSQAQSEACSYAIAVTAGMGCDQDAIDYYNTTAGKQASTMYQLQTGFQSLMAGNHGTDILIKAGIIGGGAAAASAIGGGAGDVNTLTSVGAEGLEGLMVGYTSWDEYTRKQGRKVGTLDAAGGVHNYADGDGQYGFSLSTYLDSVGNGVDLGIYYAQYDSKAPYLRFKGQRGIYAGDLLGAFTMTASCVTELAGGDGCDSDAGAAFLLGDYMRSSGLSTDRTIEAFSGVENTAWATLAQAINGFAFGEAGCGAYQNPAAAEAFYSNGSNSNFGYSSAQKSNALTYFNYTNINGKLYHDSTKCLANSTGDNDGGNAFDSAATQAAAAAIVGSAVSPLNLAEYEFIYPENLQILGMSANTNIGSTTVQAEVTYRPDFPLHTDAGDQGQQLSDAAGTSGLLSVAVAQNIRTGCLDAVKKRSGDYTNAVSNSSTMANLAVEIALDGAEGSVNTGCGPQMAAVLAYRAKSGNSAAEWADVVGTLKDFKRSSLPAISLATVANGDYYTTPYFEYDVWTATLGTTTSFSASHPVTRSLGADSSVLLTEWGIVSVPDLTGTKAVARGGFRDGVGGDKCGGVTGGATGSSPTTFNALRVLDAATHLGSSQTDPLFGNGSYCESKNNIDKTSMTYRIIGSATYNNVANSTWTFSPSFVWSHDFSGYGPTTMGGFVPGRQSLSLSGNLTKGDVKVGISYVNQMGDEKDNLAFDRDYVSANVSYAF